MAAKAVALAEARQPEFATYAQAVADNAVSLADGLMRRGARLVTGGTDNHLVLLDVSSFGLTGRQAESALLDSGIVTNRNAIPRDPNGAWYTSGVRIGTPALTSRGFGADDFDRVAALIVDGSAGHQPDRDRRRLRLEGEIRAPRGARRPHPGGHVGATGRAPPLPGARPRIGTSLHPVPVPVPVGSLTDRAA